MARLVRTASGLLFRDSFDREDGPPGPDYTTTYTGPTGWRIEGGVLKANPSEGVLEMYVVPVAPRNEVVVQATIANGQQNGYAGLLVRGDPATRTHLYA